MLEKLEEIPFYLYKKRGKVFGDLFFPIKVQAISLGMILELSCYDKTLVGYVSSIRDEDGYKRIAVYLPGKEKDNIYFMNFKQPQNLWCYKCEIVYNNKRYESFKKAMVRFRNIDEHVYNVITSDKKYNSLVSNEGKLEFNFPQLNALSNMQKDAVLHSLRHKLTVVVV